MPLVSADPKIVIKSLFSILYFLKKNKHPPFFAPPLRKLRGGAKKWGCLFFFKKYKIENSDFITILGSAGTKGMMPITKFC